MPCSSDGYPDETIPRLKRTADAATRVACELSRVLNNMAPAANCFDVGRLLSKETRVWIAEHERQDREREEAERRERERAEKKRRALSKLTPEEARLLGVRK